MVCVAGLLERHVNTVQGQEGGTLREGRKSRGEAIAGSGDGGPRGEAMLVCRVKPGEPVTGG